MKSSILYSHFAVEWDKEMKKEPRKRSFTKAILRDTGKCYWATGLVIYIIAMFLSFVPVIVMNLSVEDLDNGSSGSFPLLP